MKNLIFIPFVIFIIFLCAFVIGDENRISKKEMMESWAWKIFIFTDEVEFIPNESVKNNFDNSTKDNPIFVEDVIEIYSEGDLFMHIEKGSFKDPIVFANFAETERKK
jgi:hypothetical protein